MALVVSTTSKVSSGFDPRTIPDCALWLDAADRNTLTLSGSNVTQWNDKSGNGVNLTAASSNPVYQSNQINGLPGLVFSGSNRLMASYTYATQSTAFLVYTTSVVHNARIIDINNNGYGNVGIFYTPTFNPPVNAELGIWLGGSTFPQQGIYTSRAPESGVRTYSIVFNGTSSQIWRNGGLEALNATGAGFAGTANGTLLALGAGTYGISPGSDTFIGTLGEVLLFKANLTTAQRQQVEGYLARKWGLSSNLPATHLYRSIPIVTRAFQPIDIPDCALWLDGADSTSITLTGSNVTQWSDKSGRGCNATKPAAGTITFSNNRIVFNGTSYLSLPSGTFPTGNSNYSFLTVGSTDRSSYQNIFFTGNYSAGQSIDAIYYPDGSLESGWYSSNIIAPAGTISANQTTLVENVYSSPTLTAYVNGTSVASSSSLGTRNNPSGVAVLGANLEGNQALKGTMCEFLLYSNGLTASQRQQIEGYLAAKWGLRTNLPSTHPFKLVPAITPVFTPLQISGCQLWLDAADATTLTLSGSSVTQWNDKSGNGYNASGGISPAYSNSGVVFDGSTMSLLTSYTAQPTTETILLVCSFNASASVGGFPLGTTIHGGRSVNMGYSSGTVTVMWDKLGYWGNASSSASISAGTRFLTTMVLYNATNASTSLNAANQSSIATFPNSFFGGGTTRIGAALTSGSLYAQFYGTINEIIVYNSALSRSQYQQLEGYLAAKWGLKSSLPTTHPFKVITP